jgi:hypothetical protein
MFAVERKAYFLLSSVAFPFLARLGRLERCSKSSAILVYCGRAADEVAKATHDP